MCLFAKKKEFEGETVSIINNQILIKGKSYQILENTTDLNDIKESKDFKNGQQSLNNVDGIYMFIMKKSIKDFKLKKFDKAGGHGSTQINEYFIKKMPRQISIKQGQLFMVGSDKNVLSRCREHIISDKVNGLNSLRLGIKKRSFIKEYLKVYFIYTNQQRTQIETSIRDMLGCIYGNK